MDFEVPDKTQKLVATIRDFLAREVAPLERPLAEQGFFAIEARLKELRARVKEQGMWGPQIPTDLGGMGLSLMDHALVTEALGRSPLGHYVFGCQAPDAGNIEILHLFGTDEQKRRWLVPLAAGQIRSCFSMTEPDSPGSNPTQLACRARLDGDQWVVDGKKWFTSSADGAAFAIVMAVTSPEAPPHKRASMIIVPTDTRGFRRVRNISVMGHPGEGHQSHAEIAYEDCRVPRANLLGEEGAGFAIAQERLGPGRIHHCMRWLGICDRAFELMCRRAATRQIDDRELLGDKGIVQAWIAECRARIAAARLLVLDTAWRIDRGGFRAAAEQISLIKFHVAGVMQEVLDRAIQVHGALGITDETPLAMWWGHERGARIYDGPDEVHKIAAARRILKRVGRG
jgi:alkylation response protein AidB-like acyl-CoA dehydrogenase